MANGDVHDSVSDQYLQQFDRSVGVAGMQKLQEFPSLQKLGYHGQLGSMKNDFHGLTDFKTQMSKYSSVSKTLKIAWSLISAIVPNNISILRMLFTAPGLGTVGNAFKSIHGFGQVFALSAGDLKSPATVASKAAAATNQSTQTSVVTDSSTQQIGGGSGLSFAGNASLINGFQVIGTPTSTNNSLHYDGVNLVWGPGSGGGASTLASLLDVLISAPTNGQVLTYDSGSGKWKNVTQAAGSTLNVNSTPVSNPNFIDGSDIIFHVSGSNITLEVSGGISSYQLRSEKDTANGYAGLTAGGLLKSAEFPIPTTSTFGGVKDKAAVATQFVTSVVNGIPILAQPAYTDLTGTPQLAITKTAVTSNWLRSYDSTTGLFTASQPDYTDLTGTPTLNFLPLTGGTLTGDLLFSLDNTKDIGALAATRPRTGYFGTSLLVPVVTAATSVTAPIINATTGFRIAGAAASRRILRGDGTNFVVALLTPAASITTAHTAAIGLTTLYTVVQGGVKKVSYYFKVTTAATISSSMTLTINWTDRDDNTAMSVTIPTPANAVDSTGMVSGSIVMDVEAAGLITYQTTYASSGATAMAFKLKLQVEDI